MAVPEPNMTEMNGRGRENEETARWLSIQPWYGQFLSNVRNDGCGIAKEDDLLGGNFGRWTIRCAFVWKDTPEGFDFWEKQSTELEQHLSGAGGSGE